MWLRSSLLFVFILALAGPFQNELAAKSYEIPHIRVEVDIRPDGSVRVVEHLTYHFDGSFSWAEYRLPKQGFLSISNVQITENDEPFVNKNTEETGTFSVSESDEAFLLRWHYKAENEERTFTVSYTLQGALTIGNRWSQFFWNYLSADRDKSTDSLAVAIRLPESTSADSLYAWLRGGGERSDIQKAGDSLAIAASHIHKNDYFKVRSLFPTRLLSRSQISITDEAFSLEQARQEEQNYQQAQAEQERRTAYLDKLFGQLNYLITVLSVAIFYFLYNRYGKRHSTSRFSDQETIMRPDDTAPAVAGWLLQNQSISGRLLMATALDLARRGYFKIIEQPPEEGFFEDDEPTFSIEKTNSRPQENLKKWEEQLLRFIENRIAEGNAKLDEMFKGSSADTASWYSEWKQNFKSYCYDKGWIDNSSYTGTYWNFGLQFMLLAAAVAALVFTGPEALLSLIVTLAAMIASFVIIRRTPEGEKAYHRWKNYREGLKNAGEHSISSDKLDSHFIYGVAFGLGKEKIEKLITSGGDEPPVFYWFVFNAETSSAASAASTFSTLSATGSTSFSAATGGSGASASSAGGGASASAG